MIATICAADVDAFRALVTRKLGLFFDDGRADFLADVLRQRIERTACSHFAEYERTCILLTASEERSGELEALDAGADAYVRKEEDSQVILARVTAVLRASAASFSGVAGPASLLGPKKILVVEDNVSDFREIAEQLRLEGCEIIGARSGSEALELLGVQLVDCILLGMVDAGGRVFETRKRIKSTSEWRGIPLIVHAPADTQQAMVDGINAGADDYIAKSSDLAVLRARVRAQLRRKQFEDENRGIRERFLQKELEVVAANSARELAEARAVFVEELERKNAELEARSYSVSHDLRAPLRSIDGFSPLLLEECAETLNSKGQDYLKRVRTSAQRMGKLIDDLLQLSRVGRAAIHRDQIDLSAIANPVVEELRRKDPERTIAVRRFSLRCRRRRRRCEREWDINAWRYRGSL